MSIWARTTLMASLVEVQYRHALPPFSSHRWMNMLCFYLKTSHGDQHEMIHRSLARAVSLAVTAEFLLWGESTCSGKDSNWSIGRTLMAANTVQIRKPRAAYANDGRVVPRATYQQFHFGTEFCDNEQGNGASALVEPYAFSPSKELRNKLNMVNCGTPVPSDLFNWRGLGNNVSSSRGEHNLCDVKKPKFVDNINANGGEQQDMEGNNLEHGENMKKIGANNLLHVENKYTSGENKSTSVEN